jgi:hypothetical protein
MVTLWINNETNTKEKSSKALNFLLTQLAPEFTCSEVWRRVWMVANREGRTIEAVIADGAMAAVEAAEDTLRA